MAQELFRAGLGFADDNIAYLSGLGEPSGAQADSAGVGSRWSDTGTGEVYTKTGAGWIKLGSGGTGTADLDGGAASTVYLAGQNFDGGSA